MGKTQLALISITPELNITKHLKQLINPPGGDLWSFDQIWENRFQISRYDVCFSEERTLSRVTPTLPPSIAEEPSMKESVTAEVDIARESLIDSSGASLHNGAISSVKQLDCNSTCYRAKKEGKSLKNLQVSL